MLFRALLAFGVLVAIPLAAHAERSITVDGRLDEPEWTSARVFNDFRITEPLSREPGRYRTEVRVLPLEQGLVFGVRFEHPRDQRTYGQTQRDADTMGADPVSIFVDFEGRGRTALEFTVSLSGSVRDSLVLNQKDISHDWDGVWDYAVAEDDAGWTAEISIPWSIAPEGVVKGNQRTIGFYVSRYLKKDNTRYAFPAIELLGATFVQNFHHIEVPRYKTSSFTIVPYASVSTDFLDSTSKGRAGVDLVWKPSASHQITATIKPDFGQVESDDLVVNFSAIETFFSDKRPFFTEGQQLFDLRFGQEGEEAKGRLINTRRIGGAPDVGPEGATNVLAGLKYTGSTGDSEYGVFSALEEDSSQASGRRYLAGRWHRRFGRWSIGYLGTYVDHPTIDREAQVHSVDFDATLADGVILNGQAIVNDIRQPGAPEGMLKRDGRGVGAWTTFAYQPGGRWQEDIALTWFDRGFDIDDFGYVTRGNLRQFRTTTRYFTRSYPESSSLATSDWYFDYNGLFNDRNERLQGWVEPGHYWEWKKGYGYFISTRFYTSGVDDLILRGSGTLRTPRVFEVYQEFFGPETGHFRFKGNFDVYQSGVNREGWSRILQYNPTYYFTDALSLGLNLKYENNDRWLIWTEGTQVATYRSDQFVAAFDLAWFPRAKHEVRLKVQWLGVRAKFRRAYDVDPDGNPQPHDGALDDFTVSNIALQFRYRYEIGPLSDVYVVYSRGGDAFDETHATGFTHGLNEAWRNRTSDEFLVKMRYRF